MLGVIAAGHPETATAGAEILRQGGNAVDAAVAATFASFVAESMLVNIGGGGLAHLYDPTTGQATVYDFFSTMPGQDISATQSAVDFRQILIDFGAAQQPFYIGRASTAVPGVVAGLCRLAQDNGTKPLPQLLAPAIRLARYGTYLTPATHYIAHLLEPILTDTPELAAIYAPNGRMVNQGEKLYFPALAETLEWLAHHGPELFYRGAIAHKIVVDQQAHHGLLTSTDLMAYQVFKLSPISIPYGDYTILLPPPSSIGGVLIAFALTLLAQFPVAQKPHNGFEHLRLLTEIMRLTNLSRREWMAIETQLVDHTTFSQASINQAVNTFLSPARLSRYRHHLHEVLAGKPPLVEPPSPAGPSNTTHVSVADAQGQLVGITTSAGESAGYLVDDTGMMLNNMLGEIDLHPNGFHKLFPGQRLTTMMCPVIVVKAGQPILALGSGGSNRIRSAILQVISNLLDFKLPLSQAVEAPRLHFEDAVVQLEGGMTAAVADQFEAAGYQVNRWPNRNMFFGGAHAVARLDSSEASWLSAGDPRRGGSVVTV